MVDQDGEAYGGPAEPSPTIAQCLNGGLGWLEVECNRCKTRASLPLEGYLPPGAYGTRVSQSSYLTEHYQSNSDSVQNLAGKENINFR